MADLVHVRVLRPLLLYGRTQAPGVVEVPALIAADLIATPRAELLEPKIDGATVRAAVEAANQRAIARRGGGRVR